MNAPARDLYTTPRSDWTREEIAALFALPFPELMFRAQSVHRAHFDPSQVQVSQLLSIKTGGCPEDCGYCSQSSHHSTGLVASKLMEIEKVVAEARKAKAGGATRYCMGAAWRNPKPRDMGTIIEMVGAVKALGLETCMTLGMLDRDQSDRLSAAGLDYYNHNIDTSARYYPQVTSTRSFADRLDTLENVRQSGMKVCCGGILGMGEEEADRVDMLVTLANLEAFAKKHGLQMVYRRQYESPRYPEMRLRKPLFATLNDAAAKAINFFLPGKADVRHGDYHVILRKR